MAGKTAGSDAKQKPHRHWDKLVSAAYLRIMGATQAEAATSVGRNERTLRDWEANEELWQAAQAEAQNRWLSGLKHASMRALLKTVEAGNAMIGFQVAERLIPELAPAKQKHEVTGADGGAVEVVVTRRVVRPGDADD